MQPIQPLVPKQPLVSILEEPPAPPPGAPTGLQRQIPEPPTWDQPEGETAAHAEGPWYNDQTRFPKYAPVPAAPLPKAIQTGAGPVYLHETGNAATADPANVPTKAAPFNYVTASETQCYYRMGPPPDVDRGSTHDAATQPPTWTSTNTIPRPPRIFEFIHGYFYQHDHCGQVRFLKLLLDLNRETRCRVMQWHDVRKTTVTIDLPTRELWPGTSTGILMNPTARKLPRVRYFTDEPITEDQRQSQRDDPELRPGTMLIATQNFNVQGEPESCMGGIYQEVDQNLEKGCWK